MHSRRTNVLLNCVSFLSCSLITGGVPGGTPAGVNVTPTGVAGIPAGVNVTPAGVNVTASESAPPPPTSGQGSAPAAGPNSSQQQLMQQMLQMFAGGSASVQCALIDFELLALMDSVYKNETMK